MIMPRQVEQDQQHQGQRRPAGGGGPGPNTRRTPLLPLLAVVLAALVAVLSRNLFYSTSRTTTLSCPTVDSPASINTDILPVHTEEPSKQPDTMSATEQT